jgi:hypothetical protein
MREEAEDQEGFGYSLAAGDFDNDGRTDLAIEAITEINESLFGPGALHVIYGRKAGLAATDNQLFYLGSPRR